MGATKEMHLRTMYDITQEQLELMYQIELAEGELTQEMEEALEIQQKDLNQKSIAYLAVISSNESLNSQIDAEIKRLQALKKRNTNIIDRLKYNLLNAVKTFGHFEVGLTKFSTRKSESIEVEFVNELPEQYKVIKVTESADKVALKKAIKAGETIKGVTLKENLNLKIN